MNEEVMVFLGYSILVLGSVIVRFKENSNSEKYNEIVPVNVKPFI